MNVENLTYNGAMIFSTVDDATGDISRIILNYYDSEFTPTYNSGDYRINGPMLSEFSDHPFYFYVIVSLQRRQDSSQTDLIFDQRGKYEPQPDKIPLCMLELRYNNINNYKYEKITIINNALAMIDTQ